MLSSHLTSALYSERNTDFDSATDKLKFINIHKRRQNKNLQAATHPLRSKVLYLDFKQRDFSRPWLLLVAQASLSLFLGLSLGFTGPLSSPSSNDSTPNCPLGTIFHSQSFQRQRSTHLCTQVHTSPKQTRLPAGLNDQYRPSVLIIRGNQGASVQM